MRRFSKVSVPQNAQREFKVNCTGCLPPLSRGVSRLTHPFRIGMKDAKRNLVVLK